MNAILLGLSVFFVTVAGADTYKDVAAEQSVDRAVESVAAGGDVDEAAKVINAEMKSSVEMAPTPALSPAITAGPARDERDESQIPVLSQAPGAKAAKVDPLTRLLLSVAVLAAVAGGLLLIARFWSRKKSGLARHPQIKVLTQYAIGPKKNLAIIRVAGESILIGVTDHNITMIKSLSLLDEDLPLDVPPQFTGSLETQAQAQADQAFASGSGVGSTQGPNEDFSFGSVKDMVASRLREMRSL